MKEYFKGAEFSNKVDEYYKIHDKHDEYVVCRNSNSGCEECYFGKEKFHKSCLKSNNPCERLNIIFERAELYEVLFSKSQIDSE
ncbi:MAG: hypothetical protein OGM09_10525 [Fusobacterium varium]|jgi:threonine dehydrogenase-like Zn-dependent dehydrogenase|uniref:hypothetical protein n=1 Tax=Fusobacterium varium TaxID=856 RepID=UPI0024312BA1|nr:hypothetical protein [Fusobacterium varium]UYI77604.1 MAG: hypothetical protein OGM09_10525 [Fusobacterium varium]